MATRRTIKVSRFSIGLSWPVNDPRRIYLPADIWREVDCRMRNCYSNRWFGPDGQTWPGCWPTFSPIWDSQRRLSRPIAWRSRRVMSALAEIYRRQGDTENADRYYRKSIELMGPRSHILYANFLEKDRGDLAEAERQFEDAKDADEAGWGYELGSFLLRRGRDEQA